MCNICMEYEKGKMTDKEALRALGEMVSIEPDQAKPDYHYYEVIDKILDKNGVKDDTEE